MLLIVGGILAIALSPDLRSKVLDMLFGAEEEFDYTSTTAPATPAPPAWPEAEPPTARASSMSVDTAVAAEKPRPRAPSRAAAGR